VNAVLIGELGSLLDELEEDRTVVAYGLRRQAEALRGQGELHLDSVADATQRFAERARDAAARINRVAEVGTTEAESPLSLPAMRATFDRLNASLPLRKLLVDVEQLRAANGVDLTPVRAAAGELQDRLQQRTLGEDEQDLAALTSLVRLADTDSMLGDDDWDACVERVRARFGMELSVAAARGRLRLERNHTSDTAGASAP
jgi:hypothetical protein